MKNNKAAGTARERQVRKILEEDGWIVVRAGASIGPADLLALKADYLPMMVQVKANKGYAFSSFGPGDRAALRRVASIAGAQPVLAHWPPRGDLRYYNDDEWPGV
jgi:Holliday junction resolvase